MPMVTAMPRSHEYAEGERIAISEAARLVGVTVGTLRRWEAEGRITAARTPGGQRRYLPSELDALMSARTAS